MKAFYRGVPLDLRDWSRLTIELTSEEAGIFRRMIDKWVDTLPDGWKFSFSLPDSVMERRKREK